jgi:tetratricopeptide (TPR) repeat protein
VLVSLLLVISTLAVYWGVQKNGFVSYDDPVYLTENPWIQGGLSWASVKWAVTTGYANFWHPLTWLSILLDVQLFGLEPGLHHLSAVLYHIVTALLLFHALRHMTGSLWRSAMVAGLFALHPLHVESVAWASERKDVLSALFWMATLLAYSAYARRPTWKGYALTGFTFVLGMMAKPMLVTLPFVLLMLDYWPLGRMRLAWVTWCNPKTPEASTWRLVAEKVPFLILSVVFSVVAYVRQGETVVISFEKLPLATRVLNAFLSYVDYIQKTVVPVNLAARYTYYIPIPVASALGCALLLLLVSAGAVVFVRRRPYWFVGWFWYLGVLVPVIGLVQIGGFSKADRFTYIPTIGLYIAAVWGAGELLHRCHRRVLAVAAILILLVYSVMTVIQVGYWHDNITLYEHALKATREGPLAQNNLGAALLDKGRLDEAKAHFEEALKLRPFYSEAHNNLANVLKRKKDFAGAALHYRAAIRLDPDFFEARFNLANLLSDQGDFPNAERQYLESMTLRPKLPVVCFNYGNMLLTSGRLNDAASRFWQALTLDPGYFEAGHNYIQVQVGRGKLPEAEAHYLAALKRQPEVAVWHFNYASMLQAAGRQDEAVAQTREYLRMEPTNPYAEFNLGKALVLAGQFDEAVAHFQNVLKLAPQSVETWLQLANAYAEAGRFPEAVKTGESALELARASKQDEQAAKIEKRLQSFRAGKPWRDSP